MEPAQAIPVNVVREHTVVNVRQEAAAEPLDKIHAHQRTVKPMVQGTPVGAPGSCGQPKQEGALRLSYFEGIKGPLVHGGPEVVAFIHHNEVKLGQGPPRLHCRGD